MAVYDDSRSSFSSDLPPAKLCKLTCSNKPLSEEEQEQRCRQFLEDRAKTHYSGVRDTSFVTNPDKCLDPDDITTYEYFLSRKNIFVQTLVLLGGKKHRQQLPGEKIYGSTVFELYNIKIQKLDPRRYFSTISISSDATKRVRVIIYQRPEGEKITLNERLPLKNLFRPPCCLDTVHIALSNPVNGGWCFVHSPPLLDEDMVYGRFSNVVKDAATDSEAYISYELMESAAIAQLVFKFFDTKQQEQRPIPIRILSGLIFAAKNGDKTNFTRRLIRHFSSPVELDSSGVEFPVDRSTFGVPMRSKLDIYVYLEYFAGEEGPYFMEKTLTFKVPQYTSSTERCCYGGANGNVTLSVNVSWMNKMW